MPMRYFLPMITETLLESARAMADDIVALRRAIHAEPELGLHTPLTAAKVRAALADLPLTWREGGSTSGMVATLQGAAPGRRVLLRGDMDALPMPEETGLDFASQFEGRMHACGHDTHTAMLAGAARLLCERRADFAGEVQFMFQPGEEGHHGARFMLEDGLIDPLPDAAFALHIMPNAPFGVVAGKAGPLMASADQFDITVTGHGGHASMPHDTLDPIPVAAEMVAAIQSMVTRRFNAADAVVATVTQFHAGTAHNVIPDRVQMGGTLRSLSAKHREKLRNSLDQIVRGVAHAHGIAAEVTITPGFPVTVCDPRAVTLGQGVVHEVLGGNSWLDLPAPIMGAEDFAYLLEKVLGAMFFLGVAPEGDDWHSCCGIHSSRMFVDEKALPHGTAVLSGCALRFLARGFD